MKFDQEFIDAILAEWPNAGIIACDFFNADNQNGWHIVFPNRFVASIQFGAGNYCSNQSMRNLVFLAEGESAPQFMLTSHNAEFAGWFESEYAGVNDSPEWVDLGPGIDDVIGYQTPAQVFEFIRRYSPDTDSHAPL